MKKVFLSIGIVLLAMVVLVGCEDGTTEPNPDDENGTSDVLVSVQVSNEFSFAVDYLETEDFTNEGAGVYSFDLTLADGHDALYRSVLYQDPQYVVAGTHISGSVTLSGLTYQQFLDNTLLDTDYSVIYTGTVSGGEVPSGTAAIRIDVVYDDEDGFTISYTYNGTMLEYSIEM